MGLPSNQYLLGLRDLKLRRGAVQVDLPAAQKLTFKVEVNSKELRGDDEVVYTMSRIPKGTGSFSSGGYPASAIALMTGKTITETGTTPNITGVWSMLGGDSFPEFELYGQAYGQNGSALLVHLFRCVVTGGLEFNFEDDNFFVNGIDIDVLRDTGTGKIFEITQQETAAAIPTP